MTDPQAVWRPVVGWEIHYEVSSNGLIRKVGSGLPVGQWLRRDGYCMARFSNPRMEVRVHRVVAEAFLGAAPPGMVVNHIDNNPANNDASNLEWCTQRENLAHSRSQGRMPNYWQGKRSPAAALSNAAVLAIREAYQPRVVSLASLAAKHGVSKRCIGRIIHREVYADV